MADTPDAISEEVSKLSKDHESGWKALTTIRETWYDKERLLIGRLADQYSRKSARARVTDAHLSTLAWERQMRVCSQLPSGKAYATSKKNEVQADLTNLTFFKYVVPNANSQFDLLTKIRMSGVYASVYGVQFFLYDYRVDDDYVGPDCWLLPARNVIPQPGRNSVGDCDWVDVSTTVNKSYFDGVVERKSKTWNLKNIKKLLDTVKDGAEPSRDLNNDKRSAVETNRTEGSNLSSSTARIELITRYEKGKNGHWKTWAVDYPEAGVLRDIKNPHASGKIPIVARYCYPLLDSIWGLGDFERGITMQKAKDSLINLYLEAVKMSIFPPLKINETQVTSSTIRMEAGARWLMKDLNAVDSHETNPMGVQEFTSTYQFMSTALMNQFGTSNTTSTVGESGNEAFGRTPEAIKDRNASESARDSWDRYMLENAVQELYEGMINLLSEKQEKPINFQLNDEDYEALVEQYGDDADESKGVFRKIDGNTVQAVIPKSKIGNVKYQFIVDASSSLQNDEEAQNEAITQILGVYLPNMQVWDQLLQGQHKKFDAVNLLEKYIYNSGISDPEEVIEDISEEEQEANAEQQGQAQGQQMQQPSTADMANKLLSNVQQGADPQQEMEQFSQAMYRDPRVAQATSQMFGGQR